MNINQFKEDDVITQIEPCTFGQINGNGDRSYMNDKLLFVGVEGGMIVLIRLEEPFEGEIIKLETDEWSDGWGYYPQGLIDKAVSKIKSIVKSK